MTRAEIDYFIEEMKTIGDEWSPELAEHYYGEYTLDEAIHSRKQSVTMYFDNITRLLNK